MNGLYFACRTCASYIDAGYRWAYLTLERPGIVRRGEPVQLNSVFAAVNYWAGIDGAEWLAELLPRVRSFLDHHSTHDIIFGDAESFMDLDSGAFLDWLDEADRDPDLTPRYFAERLGFQRWEQVVAYINGLGRLPWWWDVKIGEFDFNLAAQEKFERLASSRRLDTTPPT